jgi:hypothetical protein
VAGRLILAHVLAASDQPARCKFIARQRRSTQHLLGQLEIGDDAAHERPDRGDIARCPAQHPLGVGADRVDLIGALVDGNHRGFGDHDAASPDVDERVRGAKVNGDAAAADPGNGTQDPDGQAPCLRWSVPGLESHGVGTLARPYTKECPAACTLAMPVVAEPLGHPRPYRSTMPYSA